MSTILPCIERFDDLLTGHVLVHGKDISTLNMCSCKHTALVSQEPTLNQSSIGRNIFLGMTNESVIQEEIEAAGRQADIDDFVVPPTARLCDRLWGQETGIIRRPKAIDFHPQSTVRNPKILLLDEPPSALGSSGMKVVQESLDQEAKEWTTSAMAHSLSTTQKVDIIYQSARGVFVKLDRRQRTGPNLGLFRNYSSGRYFEMVHALQINAT